MNWLTSNDSERDLVSAPSAHGAAPVREREQYERSAASDEQLVRGCLDGNHEAWGALIDKYRNLIFSIPIKYGLSQDDASDIFQDVCLKLLWELPRLREPRTLAAWLIKVTSHECVRWRRKQLRYGTLEIDEYNALAISAYEMPEEMLVELEREQGLREAIGELATRCRDLVKMLFFAVPPLPYDEVAKRLGLATGSIGFIRMRCLKRLRRMLEEKNFA